MKLGSSIKRRRNMSSRLSILRRFSPRKPDSESGDGGSRWAYLKDARTLWLLAVLSLAAFAGGYLLSTRVIYPLPPPPGDLFPVPDLSGESPEAVADTLAAVGLNLGVVDSLNHPTAPEGTIVGQSPLPGQLFLVGDTGRIAVSLGPERRLVPTILGRHTDGCTEQVIGFGREPEHGVTRAIGEDDHADPGIGRNGQM